MRTLRAVLAAVLGNACTVDSAKPDLFPDGFVFGTATSGFQVEMGCPNIPAAECEDRASDWYAWLTDPRLADRRASLHQSADAPASGPGFHETWREDLARASTELRTGAFRLSIEWSRLFPADPGDAATPSELRAKADVKALAWYHAVLRESRARGLEPYVTVNHQTLPAWVHDGVGCHLDLPTCTRRGWLDPSIVDRIATYAGFLGREFGAEVDHWATLNEPLAITVPAFLLPGETRTNPPALFAKGPEARTVTLAMIDAHARMYDALHKADVVDADRDGRPALVGLVMNYAPARPANEQDDVDIASAGRLDYLYNVAFVDAVALGRFDGELDGKDPVYREDLAGRVDWLGVNYYARFTVAGLEKSLLPDFSPLLTLNPLVPPVYEDAPQDFVPLLARLHDRYHLPMVVSENGAAVGEAGDEARQEAFLVQHLLAVKRALSLGVDVRGYFWWSLMDNYEWNHGMSSMRFGLYAVDPRTKARRLRPAGRTFARIAGERTIGADLAKAHPLPADDHWDPPPR
jgi:beta-galactosidase